MLKVLVHSAGIQDRDGAKMLVYSTVCEYSTIVKIFADGGYAGQLVEWVLGICKVAVDVVRRNLLHTFEVLPERWIVERTFAWLNRYRRLKFIHVYHKLTK